MEVLGRFAHNLQLPPDAVTLICGYIWWEAIAQQHL
jgi:hypothetical protein